MSSDFQVGDEVVCVNVKPLPTSAYPQVLNRLTLNAVYTVKEVGICKLGTVALRLNEVEDPPRYGWWIKERFRKVQKKFTGMEQLRGLLNTPTKQLEDA